MFTNPVVLLVSVMHKFTYAHYDNQLKGSYIDIQNGNKVRAINPIGY